MDVEILGQASTLAHAPGGVRLLTDPWFSGPAHLAAWYPVPHLRGAALERMRAQAGTATHLYVSHAHEDHFDLPFLRTLPRMTLLVGAFASSRFREAIESLASLHEVRWCADGERVALAPDVAATIHLEKPLWRTNSVLVLDAPGGRYVDANDCGLSTGLLASIRDERPAALFGYTLNFAANGWPFPYLRGSVAERRGPIAALRDEIVGGFRAAIDTLRPSTSFAFAGPVTYADPTSAFLDEAPEALDWRPMIAELEGPVPVRWPAPGSRFQLVGDRVGHEVVLGWEAHLVAPPRVDPRTDEVLAAPVPSDAELFAATERLAARLTSLVKRLPSRATPTTLVFSIVPSLDVIEEAPTQRIAIRPGEPARVLALDAALPSPRLEISTLASIVVSFCEARCDLDALLVSLRARFAREPDAFDGRLHELLRFGHDEGSVEAMERAERGAGVTPAETCVVERNGERFRIARHCPHEGERLDAATFDAAGNLVCPRHRWAFDLSTGRCVRGDKRVRLAVQPLTATTEKP